LTDVPRAWGRCDPAVMRVVQGDASLEGAERRGETSIPLRFFKLVWVSTEVVELFVLARAESVESAESLAAEEATPFEQCLWRLSSWFGLELARVGGAGGDDPTCALAES
jgi:hypothetical protein